MWENRSLLNVSHFLFISVSVSAAAGSFLEISNGDVEPGLGRCGQRPGAGPRGSTEGTGRSPEPKHAKYLIMSLFRDDGLSTWLPALPLR